MVAEQASDSTETQTATSRLAGWRQRWLRRGSRPAEEVQDPQPVRWWESAGYVSLIVGAASMRLWDLGSRAMHHDESLHAYYSWVLSDGGGYRHDPMTHGPFQFEANAAIFTVFGDSDFTSRLLYAVVGTALVALPFLLRGRLGRLGALLVAGMLAFSPAMLYFSRFARNDILVAAWTLGLVISMWKYIDEGKSRYLYAAAALLAVALATKETAYLVTAILGLFLVLTVISQGWAKSRNELIVNAVSPPVALMRLTSRVWRAFSREARLSAPSRPATFLILLVTLSLPQWAAIVSLLQDTALFSGSNIVLANPATVSPVGAPSGGGLVIAFLVVILLLGTSFYIGIRWNWRTWLLSAAIFYSIWLLLYTTFFTNLVGTRSGMWQSLGYWIVQQGESRGGQPWYYYFVITPTYEFMPLLLALVASVYYLRKGDMFGNFLVYWVAITFVLYSIASEKMPWLLVNLALPLIVLAGKFVGDVAQSVQWRRILSGGGLLMIPIIPSLLVLLWRLAFFEPGEAAARNVLAPLVLGLGALGLVATTVYLSRRCGVGNLAAFSVIPVAALLLVLTIRTAAIASYRNGDTPVEMIVYTQTTPDLARLAKAIDKAAKATGQQTAVPISVDGTNGFTWPWAWYLRRYTSVEYPSYQGTSPREPPDASVVLIHSLNQDEAAPALQGSYTEGEMVRHRWWFPEGTYRGLTASEFLKAFVDRDSWRAAMDYFLYRKGVRDRIGSEDAYVYFAETFPVRFKASD